LYDDDDDDYDVHQQDLGKY